MGYKPKFEQTETDPKNVKLRKRVKKLNKLIHKKDKSSRDRERLQKLLENA